MPAVRSDLDVVALEQVQIRFALAGLLTHQRQDGVVAAGVHHGLTVLDRAQRKVLQFVLKDIRDQATCVSSGV